MGIQIWRFRKFSRGEKLPENHINGCKMNSCECKRSEMPQVGAEWCIDVCYGNRLCMEDTLFSGTMDV